MKTLITKSFACLTLAFLFSSVTYAISIPFPVNIKCQEGERLVYIPLEKGGSTFMPKCVADI
ncbi:MAG: hypothetical protein VYD54_00985 [Bdellovibrionota bacterium]|nr:hypothetical protein [Bdellovibrionota bacterium]